MYPTCLTKGLCGSELSSNLNIPGWSRLYKYNRPWLDDRILVLSRPTRQRQQEQYPLCPWASGSDIQKRTIPRNKTLARHTASAVCQTIFHAKRRRITWVPPCGRPRNLHHPRHVWHRAKHAVHRREQGLESLLKIPPRDARSTYTEHLHSE